MHPKRVAAPTASCPRVGNRELQVMIEAAWKAGWWCEATKGGHVRCLPPPAPDGSKGRMVIVAGTPSDRRAIPNTRSTFRRAGLIL